MVAREQIVCFLLRSGSLSELLFLVEGCHQEVIAPIALASDLHNSVSSCSFSHSVEAFIVPIYVDTSTVLIGALGMMMGRTKNENAEADVG